MAIKNFPVGPREKYRQAFTVPVKSGDYANERITFGVVSLGTREESFQEITAVIESPIVPGSTVELWLPRVAAGDKAASGLTDADYTNSGQTPMTTAGEQRWQLSAWPGAQLRCKSGGTPGTNTVSATGM